MQGRTVPFLEDYGTGRSGFEGFHRGEMEAGPGRDEHCLPKDVIGPPDRLEGPRIDKKMELGIDSVSAIDYKTNIHA
jgi:hypothetical protein